MSEIATEGPYYPLKIDRIVRETHDSCSVLLEIPDALSEAFRYRAGQFLTFRVTVDGKRLVRCYSLASAPCATGVGEGHKVTVKRVDDGRVSNHVNDVWQVGSVLEVMKPAGVFCLSEREAPIVLFSGGSGITPVISIIKTALRESGRRMRLLYANRDEASIIFRNELDVLASANPDRLEIVHSLDDRDGFVDIARARSFVGDDLDADFYICGPGPFMDVAEQALSELEMSQDRIFIERFESPETQDDTPSEVAGEQTAAGTPVSITLDGTTTEITLLPGETILKGARRLGLEPPFACEEAYCGCCMAMVKEGEVEMAMNDGGIDSSQIDQGWILTCQGVPKTPCKIEYPD